MERHAMPEVASFHPQFVVDHKGHRTSVLLPIEEYETLLEDLDDLVVVAERREEPVSDHADVVSRLKADGLL
jgi:hypothetical protein